MTCDEGNSKICYIYARNLAKWYNWLFHAYYDISVFINYSLSFILALFREKDLVYKRSITINFLQWFSFCWHHSCWETSQKYPSKCQPLALSFISRIGEWFLENFLVVLSNLCIHLSLLLIFWNHEVFAVAPNISRNRTTKKWGNGFEYK